MDNLIVKKMTCARIPTEAGEFELCLFTNNLDGKEHLAMLMGDVQGVNDVLVRVHSECFTGDVLGSRRCDCGEQLRCSLHLIGETGTGVVIYLRQEGRGIGLFDKLRAYNLQDRGYDTVEANLALGHKADERDYTMAAGILEYLKIRSIRLLTNNPEKISRLEALSVTVTKRVPLETTINEDNAHYLFTKAYRMNHFLNREAFPVEISSRINGNGSHR
jgi:GTP cyclohydrolase II